MGDFRISGKNVITQSGTAEPVLASNVTLGTGIIKSANFTVAATTTLSCTTTNASITVATAATSSLSVGMAVSGTNIPANANIVTIPNATSFTITSAATGAATSTLTFKTGIISTQIEDDAVTSAKVSGLVKGDVGLGNVDNTTDALKPVSTAASTALGLKADQTALDAISVADADAVPHIIPGKLYPAVAGKLMDGSTSHSGAYGTAQADSLKYYYTDIKGSKPIKDPRIGAHFGSQRHMFSSAQLLEQETATHGANVYSVDGRNWCRFVDSGANNWEISNAVHGVYFYAGGGTNPDFTSYFEFTGYFNAVNWNTVSTTDAQVNLSIDGVITADFTGGVAAVGSPLLNRYVGAGSVVNLVFSSTPTLGIHTVRIGTDAASKSLRVFGIELISQDTTSTATKSQIQIPSQNVVSYGKKFTVSGTPHYNPFAQNQAGSAVAIADTTSHGKVATGWAGTGSGYFDDTLDTATSLGLSAWETGGDFYRPVNGGRVVKWVDSSGNIKTSVNMMPPTGTAIGVASDAALPTSHAWTTVYQPKLSSTTIDHSQAEVAKKFHWREFGNGAANQGNNTSGSLQDFSMLNASDDICYVMDDGLTSFSGDDQYHWQNQDVLAVDDKVSNITFIGTGISFVSNTGGTHGGGTICQNLPYGTHIIRIMRDDGDTYTQRYWVDGVYVNGKTSGYPAIAEITFHQPKRPPVPEDAVVLADYMLMADYVKVGDDDTNSLGFIGKGSRLCVSSRDFLYNDSAGGSFTTQFNVPLQGVGGHDIYKDTTTANAEVPFFGTSTGTNGYSNRYTPVIDGSAPSNITEHESGWRSIKVHDPVTLGLHILKVGSAQNLLYFASAHFASPIHTSSHYQSFETPFLHELVGGDRNMEQTNLVVTPDGKIWDEVTRDVSYIGVHTGMYCGGTPAVSAGNHTFEHYDFYRGAYSNSSTNDALQKNFALAYDKIICLENGWYTISFGARSSANVEFQYYLRKNGQDSSVGIAANSHGGDRSGVFKTVQMPLKRGDYLQVYASAPLISENGRYNTFQITKIGN